MPRLLGNLHVAELDEDTLRVLHLQQPGRGAGTATASVAIAVAFDSLLSHSLELMLTQALLEATRSHRSERPSLKWGFPS